MSTSLWRTQRGPCSTWAYQSGGPTFWSSMPRPTARATATLRARTLSSSPATAPPPTRDSQLTSNGYSAEEHDLSAPVPYRYAGVYKRVSENSICRKPGLREELFSDVSE